jgi:hypothetical protein
MMKKELLTLIGLMLLLCPVMAQPPPDPKPAPKPLILFPEQPTPPAPKPLPVDAAIRLEASVLYVVRSDVPLIVLTSPAGLLKVSVDAGPIRIKAVFSDGDGTSQSKMFTEKNVYSIEAVGAGLSELIVIPTGATGEKDVQRRIIDANNGPRPPPDPGPGPKPPDPPTPAPIPLAGFRVLIVYDPATITPDQQGIVFGKKVRDYLQAKCVVGADGKTKDFWILQKSLDVSAAPKWIGDAMQRHPGAGAYMLVSDGKTGYDGPIPANADAALAIMQKVGGP